MGQNVLTKQKNVSKTVVKFRIENP